MSDRYDRQVRLFGSEGQARIQAANVALLGTGGNGMHVVQQLAYAGVTNWTFVEFDETSESNLNRLVTATPADVGRPKIDVAFRLVTSLHPGSQPTMIQGRIGDPEITEALNQALATATLAIGCFDLETPRLEAVKACSRAGVPYLDLASEILPSKVGAVYGGRVVFTHDGTGCLVCLGVIDMAELAREGMTGSQGVERNRMYGLGAEDLGDSGPSVITINGVVASLACTEALVFLTGLRAPARQLIYDGNASVVRKNMTCGDRDCLYCYQWRQPRAEAAADRDSA